MSWKLRKDSAILPEKSQSSSEATLKARNLDKATEDLIVTVQYLTLLRTQKEDPPVPNLRELPARRKAGILAAYRRERFYSRVARRKEILNRFQVATDEARGVFDSKIDKKATELN